MERLSTFFDILTIAVFAFSGSVLSYQAVRWAIRKRDTISRRTKRGFAPATRFVIRGVVKGFNNFAIKLVLAVVIGLLIAEAGVRFYFERYGSEDDRIRYVYSAEKINSLDAFYVGKSFLNYGLSPDHPDHNSMGFRGPEFDPEKAPGVFRIVTIGGSTTYGYGVIETEYTYPAQLESMLHNEYALSYVEVINAGVPNYTTWELLVDFEFRILELDPDLIIYYGATNDITARIVYPEYYDGLYSARGLWQTHTENYGPSVLLRYVAVNLDWMRDPASLEGKLVSSDIPQCNMWTERQCGEYRVETLMALNPPIYFERNLRNIVTLAEAHGVQVMLSSWTYFPDTTSVTNIYTFPWRRKAVDEHNAIIRQVADDTSAEFYDLYGNMPYGREYWISDGYHQSSYGCEEQARQYAAFIMAQGWIG